MSELHSVELIESCQGFASACLGWVICGDFNCRPGSDVVATTSRGVGNTLQIAEYAVARMMHFAKGLPWAHLDIASSAWTYAERPDSSKGPNAFGVRLLVRWLEKRAAGGK